MPRARIYLGILLFLFALNLSTQDIATHRGKEFILSFIAQHIKLPLVPYDPGNNTLYITTFENNKINVHVPALKGQQGDQQFSVSALGVKVVTLPGKLRFGEFTGKDTKGIRITANKPISVYGYGWILLGSQHIGEGFLGLPVDVLGKEYIVPTYSPIGSSIVQVVAKEDNTQVSFMLRLPRGGRVHHGDRYLYSGDLINTTLNDLEVFQVQGDSDLSGTVVTSSKPVAVFSGDDCTMVPANKFPCNHLVEQIPPLSFWGKEFITNPTPNNFGGDEFHIIASKDNTDVNVDWQKKETLNKGDKYEISVLWNKTSVITTSNPSLVVQYTSGDGSSPSMSIVPPTKCSWNDYTVYVPGVDVYVNVIIDTASRSGLGVKGPVASGSFKWETLSRERSLGSLHLNTTGVYHIYHNDLLVHFTSVMYGTFSNASFSFPAGLRWELPNDQRCTNSTIHGGDGIDNDCDGITDEELFNGKDDDNDGQIDEDLVTARPNATFPKDYLSPPLLSCDSSDSSSNVDDPKQAGFSPTVVSTSALCSIRGDATIHRDDKTVKSGPCYREIDRTWKVKDGCGNEIKHVQHLAISFPNDPKLTFPPNVSLFCRDKKYLDPTFTGKVLAEVDRCLRNVTISPHKERSYGECSTEKAKIERVWTVIDKCRGNIVNTQVIKLVPKGSKRTTNFVTEFSITNKEFSPKLSDKTSSLFKTDAATLEGEMEEALQFSKLGKFFVDAEVVEFREGSVVTSMLIKVDMQAQVDHQSLLNIMQDTLSNGSLGGYQVNSSSVVLKDFDECKDPKRNECHKKAKCTNTEGSYNCTCIDGYVGNGTLCQAPPSIDYTDPPLVSATKENVTLTCHASGLPEPTFTWITPDGTLVNATAPVRKVAEKLDDDSEVFTGKELQEDGSLFVYYTRVDDRGVYKCVATNVLGQAVGNVSLKVREDIVEVSAVVTLEEKVFDEELENKTSPKYQELERNVKQELTVLFQNITGFLRVDILGFYNGSVKVRFRVVVKVDKQEEKPAEVVTKVGETLRDNVKKGKIGSLKVKETLEMEEVPPPPVNVQYSDVKQTEARITWSHPELYEEYAISSYSLQFKKFGTKTWTQFADTRGDNHRLTNLQQGTPYIVRLKSVNKFGRGDPSETLELQTEEEKKTSGSEIALAIVLPILFVILLAIAGVFVYRRWKKKKQGKTPEQGVPLHPLVPESPNQTDAPGTITFGSNDRYYQVPGMEPNGASPVAIGASFSWREIPRDRLILGKVLGEGEFGMVVKGELTEDDGRTIPCAVKQLKRAATESDFKDLLNELEIMNSVGNHPNLINLIGACSVGGPLMILVEFAENGNLLKYLRDHRQQNYDDMNQYSLDISSSQRLRIACDVANGMTHLAAKKCAHRDLAARNVLLGEGLVAKVSDFGLSRDIYTDDVYEKKTGGKLPAKWMAVEALEQGIYTSQSDVWSYGVLLWEIETGGCAPYAGMVVSELLSKIKAGSRLEKPRYSSDWMYTVMLRCWDANPKKRPTFEELSDELNRMYKQETDYLAPEEFRLEPDYLNTSVENVSSA